MDRIVAWGLTACLLPLGLIAAAITSVTAADFENVCLEEAAESFLCRDGDPTTAYDVTLWGFPSLLLVLWLLTVALVVVASGRSRKAWFYPVVTLVLGIGATAAHVWAFNLG